MPFCPQCGVENPASARFCDQCGATLIPVPGQPGGQPAPAPAVPVAAPAAPVAPAAPAPAGMASAGPSSCPQCGAGVIPGEAFCDNCGASLLTAPTPAPAPAAPTLPYAGVPPQPAYPAPQPVGAPPAPPAQPAQPAPIVTPPMVTPPVVTPPAPVVPAAPVRSGLAPASLSTPAGASLPLPAGAQAVIGRADPVSNFFPDVDLTPHGALDNGVGRRHARIFLQNGAVFVEDMDSTNGSFLNGARLAPRQPQPLKSGDELRLGTLVLRAQL